MSCGVCAQLGRDHDQIVADCLASPRAVGYYLCGFDKLASGFHGAMNEWFTKKLLEGKKRFIIMVPRAHLKTSMFGIATLVWRNIVDREARTMYVMASSTESMKTNRVVQQVHMSDSMKHFFPGRVLDRKLESATREFTNLPRSGNYREHTVEARGVNSTITGGHFTWQIFDDLIDKTMAQSEKEQDGVIDFFRDATNLFVDPEKDVRLVVGTLWEGRFYEWLIEDSGLEKYYEKLILGCRVDDRYRNFLAEIGKTTTLKDGDPIWPEQFNNDTLEYIEAEEGPLVFARQFLNIKTTDEDRRFREEDFQYYVLSADGTECVVEREGTSGRSFKVPVSRMYRTMVVDPATGEGKKTDESAISVVGQDKETGLLFVLDEWAWKVQPHALIEQILRMAKQWNPHKIGPEDVSYQKTLKTYLRDEMARQGLSYYIDPVKPHGRSKLTRIDALQPYVRNQQLYVQRGHFKLIQELCGLQIVRGELLGKSPNRADALAYHVDFWRPMVFKKPASKPDIPYWDAERERREEIPCYGLEEAV